MDETELLLYELQERILRALFAAMTDKIASGDYEAVETLARTYRLMAKD